NMGFAEAGKAVGAGRRKTGQMLRAYKGLKQMEGDPIFGDKANPELFSHFEQAWVKAPIREWLSWDESSMEFKNLNTFQLFCKWITEDNAETKQKKLTAQEVRDKLSLVITSEEAKKKLIQDEVNLDTAYGMAMLDKEGFTGWHSAIKNATTHIAKIPWTYTVTEEDKNLLNQLLETITKFLSKG
ncbi:MAG: hypothetical protein LLG04_19120, partial [Parachlamydia sp.]|nr:hypothetical protein [Parachlamydia sp.]